MNAGLQVFVYPEELEHTEPDELVEQVLGLGCDAVSVAVAYHPARRVLPRHRRISVLARSTLYLAPERSRYGPLVPEGTAFEPLLRFARPATRRGCGFAPGSSACTTASLPPRIPRRQRSCSTAPRGPQPLSVVPEAVEYVAALAGDVAAQLSPELVDLEAASIRLGIRRTR